jgi:hypothetical protein
MVPLKKKNTNPQKNQKLLENQNQKPKARFELEKNK